MRYRQICESPIGNLEVHNMDEPGTFPEVDRKLLRNPAHLAKVIKRFEDVPFVFNLYFINQPHVQYSKPIDAEEAQYYNAKQDSRFTERFTDDMKTGGVVSGQDVQNRFGVKLEANPEAISIVFLSNANEVQSMPLSPWMIAHRIGHAITDTLQTTPVSPHIIDLPDQFSRTRVGDNRFVALGLLLTMRSARKGDLQKGEMREELIAQYLTTGFIALKPTPEISDIPNIAGILRQPAHRIEQRIEAVLDDCIGKILLAV